MVFIGVRNTVEQIKLAASFPMPPMQKIGHWRASNDCKPTSIASNTISFDDIIKVCAFSSDSRERADGNDLNF